MSRFYNNLTWNGWGGFRPATSPRELCSLFPELMGGIVDWWNCFYTTFSPNPLFSILYQASIIGRESLTYIHFQFQVAEKRMRVVLLGELNWNFQSVPMIWRNCCHHSHTSSICGVGHAGQRENNFNVHDFLIGILESHSLE